MLDKWFKEEKPIFTGVSRGVGGFGFGTGGGGGAWCCCCGYKCCYYNYTPWSRKSHFNMKM